MKILSITEPLIEHIPEDTNILAVICQYDEGYKWVMNEYIQTYIYKEYHIYTYEGIAFSHILEMCPLIKCNTIDRLFIKEKNISIIEFIKESIDLGYYVIYPLDTIYLACYDNYKKYNMCHRPLIYGYDEDSFYIADFFEGKYCFRKCLIPEILVAFNNADESLSDDCSANIQIFKFNEKKKIEFNILLLKKSLLNYLNTKEDFFAFKVPYALYSIDYEYGINYYNVLIKYCNDYKELMDTLYLRPFSFIIQHKKLMNIRLDFIKQFISIKNYQELNNLIKVIMTKSKKLLNLAIKFNITKNDNIRLRLIKSIDDLKNIEIKFIEKFIESL